LVLKPFTTQLDSAQDESPSACAEVLQAER
jgi:hypothetical protein